MSLHRVPQSVSKKEVISLVPSRDEVAKKVIEVLADKLHRDIEDIKLDSALVEDLVLDSFATIEMLFELEDLYGIEIPDEALVDFNVVEDIVNYLEGRLEGSSPISEQAVSPE